MDLEQTLCSFSDRLRTVEKDFDVLTGVYEGIWRSNGRVNEQGLIRNKARDKKATRRSGDHLICVLAGQAGRYLLLSVLRGWLSLTHEKANSTLY